MLIRMSAEGAYLGLEPVKPAFISYAPLSRINVLFMAHRQSQSEKSRKCAQIQSFDRDCKSDDESTLYSSSSQTPVLRQNPSKQPLLAMSSFIPVHKNPFEILDSSNSPHSKTPPSSYEKTKSSADVKVTNFKYKFKADGYELNDNKENAHALFVEDVSSGKIMDDLEKQLVEITHKVELIDTYMTCMVPRHTPMPDLKELKTVQSMQNSFGGSVHVIISAIGNVGDRS